MRIVNINAPLGGTFIPGVPTSGVRPLGAEAGNVFEYQSTGHSVGNVLSVNINGTLKKVQFWGGYNLAKSRSTDGGQSGSAFDAYDFSNEFARGNFSSLNFVYGGGSYTAPGGINLNMFLIGSSGPPFNITTGRDTNGDTILQRASSVRDRSERARRRRYATRRFRSNTFTRADDHPAQLWTCARFLICQHEYGEGVQVW